MGVQLLQDDGSKLGGPIAKVMSRFLSASERKHKGNFLRAYFPWLDYTILSDVQGAIWHLEPWYHKYMHGLFPK